MPISRNSNDFNDFSDWESFTGDDEIYMGVETDLLDDWEDDGAIAQVRETPIEKPVSVTSKKVTPKLSNNKIVKKPPVKKAAKPKNTVSTEDAEVFSMIDHTNAKSKSDLTLISGPSEEELLEIESIGVELYIDNVLLEENVSNMDVKPVNNKKMPENDEDFGEALLQDEDDIKAKIIAFEEIEMQNELEVLHSEVNMIELDDIENDPDIDLNVTPVFSGLGCALVTLFDEDCEVEYKLTARLAKRLVTSNTSAIFVVTHEGEGATLKDSEKIKLVSEVKKSVGNNAKVIADVSSPSIRQSLELSNQFVGLGIDALLIEISPDTKDAYLLVESIHNAAYETPILIRLSGEAKDLPISPEFLYDLPIDGIIDATGDASFLLHLTSTYTGPVYIGSTSLILMGHSLGVLGVVLPSIVCDEMLVKQAFEGNVDAQHELAMIERDYSTSEIEQIKIGLENAFLSSSTMRN